jgi:hypothetical protein
MNTRRQFLVWGAVFAAALGACAPASSPGTPRVAALHRRQCGRCHAPPEPGTRSRDEVECAAERHRKRVRLTQDEWSVMIDYLAAKSN